MSTEVETVSASEAPEYAPAQFVRWFREVAPYVHTMRGKTFVIGFGGDLVQEGKLNALVQDLSLLTALGVRLVLVFGSRPQVNEQLRLKGYDFQFGLGIEPTSAVALECCKEAAGEIRWDIEAAFSQGLPNTPMSNSHIHVVSGNFVTAQPAGIIDGVDYRHTGKVRKFDTESINRAMALGAVVLLGPIGFSPTGEAFNIAMEDLATNTAIALKADKLIFINKATLLRDSNGEIVTEIARADVDTLLASDNSLDEEFRNFLRHASRAVRRGVKRAHIIPHDLDGSILLEYFTHDGVGTMVVEDTLDDLRPATVDDIGAIVSLIEPLEADGTLVPRGRHIIERDVDKFTVLEHDGIIYGCVSLMPYPEEKMAEMACLIVHPDWQSTGEGEILLRHTESKARALGFKKLFVLTTRTSHWFIKRGFVQGSISDLPAEKQMNYNRARNSLIFIKKL
ncbi:amino-acid N-acetyltransferase [Pelistega europaea]|uniref:Amino-acid acetyltransferase n=1 Tax=Pelistega europaea TaxID=106147 RepID=A0A7Y4LBT0_9BURK|nr:amino-acid N-acetyltransferase [Pelistega europaea]NOL49656.1 amino-acid N-acetyltransferase [Pelistega europaea]